MFISGVTIVATSSRRCLEDVVARAETWPWWQPTLRETRHGTANWSVSATSIRAVVERSTSTSGRLENKSDLPSPHHWRWVKLSELPFEFLFIISSPHGLNFTWWGCCGLCLCHEATEIPHSFLFCSCVNFSLYGPFNCISFHKFSQPVCTFSLCSFALFSALLVFSTMYLFMKVSLSPDIILCGWA